MKHLKLFVTLLLFGSIFFLVACNDDDEKKALPLQFEKEYYEVRKSSESYDLRTFIPLLGGSRNYDLSIKDPKILEVGTSFYDEDDPGMLLITGKEKGSTTITVTDTQQKTSQTITIKVVDFYTSVSITKSNHPILKESTVLFLVNNETKDCYLFSKENEGIITEKTPLLKGTFSLIEEDKTPYLIVTYSKNEKEVSHKFDIQQSKYGVVQFLNGWFQLGWEIITESKTRTSIAKYPIMNLKEVDTEYEAEGFLHKIEIPEKILD